MTFINNIKFFGFALGLAAIQACSSANKSFPDKVEAAHHKVEFYEHNAVVFDLKLYFGEIERFNGTITWATNSSKGLIKYKNGNTINIIEDEITYSDTSISIESARFTAYTWSYFFMLPYKLNDPGTKWETYKNHDLKGKEYAAEKLTFESGTGDAPDDWYIVYADKETMLTHTAAYIVTANKSLEEAERDPHAIKYENYKEVNGVPFAHKWTFWGWNKSSGLTDQLGNAELSNIRFLENF